VLARTTPVALAFAYCAAPPRKPSPVTSMEGLPPQVSFPATSKATMPPVAPFQ